MNARDFLRDRFPVLVLHAVCMGLLALFLRLTGYSGTNTALILIFWVLIAGAWYAAVYWERRRYFRELEQLLENTDQRYLLGELLPETFRLEDRLYRSVIRRSNKSVIEKIRQIEAERRGYQEYIESWVHEVKAPITGISLLCENGRRLCCEGKPQPCENGGRLCFEEEVRELLRSVSLENQRIENYVDFVIYYARSEQVYKDFLIRETDLQRTAEEVLTKNRLLLIQHRVQVRVDCPDRVYTDKKWIAFILNQMVLNSVKYCREEPFFSIETRRERDGVLLTFADNGVGIRAEELPRIFEKGFTGSNGRSRERATGMGLYLCKRLCERLGIGIRAEAVYGEGTRLFLLFPISNYIANAGGDVDEASVKLS